MQSEVEEAPLLAVIDEIGDFAGKTWGNRRRNEAYNPQLFASRFQGRKACTPVLQALDTEYVKSWKALQIFRKVGAKGGEVWFHELHEFGAFWEVEIR